MTRHRSFKRLVRLRMQKTGESYTAAPAVLLAGEGGSSGEGPPLATSDESIRERTGRGWEEWLDLLDGWGAAELSHRDIARRIASELGIQPLAWNAQAITTSYERARGLRAVGERADGSFTITAQRTVAVPVERLYDAFVEPSERATWLTGIELRERTAARPKSARFDSDDSESRVSATFETKGETSSTLTVEHARLSDADEADRMRAFWRDRLTALKSRLEEVEAHA